jgi:hypothetical protein
MSSLAATPLIYVECDVPEGMTLDDWRRTRSAPARRRRFAATVRRARSRVPA